MKRLYTGFTNSILIALCIAFVSVLFVTSTTVDALPSVNKFDQDPGLVLSDQDFYSLPLSFSTPLKIQQYFVGRGSFLANYNTVVSLEPDSAILLDSAFASRPEQYRTPTQLGPYLGQTMSAAEIIWRLSRTSMSSSCSMIFSNGQWSTNEICYDSAEYPINPGFLLAMIQKESGLVYGTNSRLDPNSPQAQFLLDRVVGYYCFEDPNRANSCFDENPNWRFYKGFFRQLFWAVRLLRLREQMCRVGGPFAFSNVNGVFQVGNFVAISGRMIKLKNGISCSMYIYTPHIISQRLALEVMHELQIGRNLIEISGLPPEYIPAILITFGEEDNEEYEEVTEDELVVDPPDVPAIIDVDTPEL
jgi:hypothetical protein